jgi:hypothetical protein
MGTPVLPETSMGIGDHGNLHQGQANPPRLDAPQETRASMSPGRAPGRTMTWRAACLIGTALRQKHLRRPLLPGIWTAKVMSRFQPFAEWRSTPTNERKNADRHQRLANAAVRAAAIEGAFARREHSIGIAGGFHIQSACHRRMIQFGDTVRRGQGR